MTRTSLGDAPVGLDAINVEHLARITYWDGALEQEVLLSTAMADLTIDVGDGGGDETWLGSGLLMSVSGVDESTDLDAPGVDIVFDGVSTAIMSIIMNNDFRGRPIEIWRIWLDPETGVQPVAPSSVPLLLFRGFQDEGYVISESFTELPDVVSVSTRAVGLMSRVSDQAMVKSNMTSHNEMLERAGVATGDTAFQNVVAIAGKEIFWGRPTPSDYRTIETDHNPWTDNG